MPIVGFEQDPQGAPGAGLFHTDDGQPPMYAHDPGLAQSLSAPGAPAPAVPNMSVQPPPNMSPAPPPAAPNMSVQPPPVAAPQGPPAQPAPSAITSGQPVDPSAPEAIAGYAFAPQVVQGSRGGYAPKGQTQTVETEGLPYTPEGVAQRADTNINLRAAHQATAEHEAALSQAQAEGARAALPELQARADAAQAERDAQHAQYQAERADLDGLIQQTASKQIDPNRWFKSVGELGQIGSIFGQALGAYAAMLGHGENYAQKMVDSAIERDIAAQRTDIEHSNGSVKNAMWQLQQRYGDKNQAEEALRIALHSVADNERGAYAAATKSQAIIDANAQWDAENQVAQQAREEKLAAAAMGKRTVAQSSAYHAPTQGGVVARSDASVGQRLDNMGKFQKLVAPDDGKTAAKDEKANELTIYGLDGQPSQAARPEEATKIRRAAALRSGAVHKMQELKALVQKAGDGARFGADKGQVLVLMKRGFEQINQMGGEGVFKADDAEYYTNALFGATGGARTEVVDRVISIADQEYQSMVDSQHGPAVDVKQTTKGPKIAYTGGQRAAPTSGGSGGPKRVIQ